MRLMGGRRALPPTHANGRLAKGRETPPTDVRDDPVGQENLSISEIGGDLD